MSSDYFSFLKDDYPTLYELGHKTECFYPNDLISASVYLRLYSEELLSFIYNKYNLTLDQKVSFFEKIDLLKTELSDINKSNLVEKFHFIRIIANKGVHGKNITMDELTRALTEAILLGLTLFDSQKASKIKASIQEKTQHKNKELNLSFEKVFEKPLNTDQSNCIKALEEFLNNENKSIFLLKGDAGTGKTFLAKGILDYLSIEGRRCMLSAPTGRAARGISKKCDHNASTLHRLIYDFSCISPSLNEDANRIYAPIKDNQSPSNSVYLIDEASLISDIFSDSNFFKCGSGILLKDLIEYVGFHKNNNHRKIIFLGDPSQLTPVGMDFTPALNYQYLKQKYNISASEFYLKEVMRQTAESDIYKNTKPLALALEQKKFPALNFSYGNNVKEISSIDITPLYLKCIETNSAIIVTQTNREAAELNRDIRSILFTEEPFVTTGDKIIITKNNYSYGLLNGDICTIGRVSKHVESRTLSLKRKNKNNITEEHKIRLSFRNIEIIKEDKSTLKTKILDDLLHNNASSLTEIEEQALYIDFEMRFKASGLHEKLDKQAQKSAKQMALMQDPYFNAIRAKFAYAITCHKAQGGEWHTAFINFSNINKPRTEGVFRWIYTALTRASNTLYLANPVETKIHIVATPQKDLDNNHQPSSLSLEQNFKNKLEEEIQERLNNTEIQIQEILHNQYQEAVILEDQKNNQCRINISYNGKFKISSIRSPENTKLSEVVLPLLETLKTSFSTHFNKTDETTLPDFITEYDKVIKERTKKENIDTTLLQELPYGVRYQFHKGKANCMIDIFYNKQEQFTSAKLVSGKQKLNIESQKLVEIVSNLITNSLRYLEN